MKPHAPSVISPTLYRSLQYLVLRDLTAPFDWTNLVVRPRINPASDIPLNQRRAYWAAGYSK